MPPIDPNAVTILTCLIASVSATIVALINANSRQAKSEQKMLDAIENLNKELSGAKNRIEELSDTDSCCASLKVDVDDIKIELQAMSASLNQFKATSDANDEMIKEGFKNFAKDRLNQGHRYFMNLGYIDEKSKESLHGVYKTYKECKGNTFIDAEMKDIDELPEINSLVMKLPKSVKKGLLRRLIFK